MNITNEIPNNYKSNYLKLKLIQIKCLHITTNTRQYNTGLERESSEISINIKQKFHHWYGFGLEWRVRRKGGEAWGHRLSVDQRKQRGFKREIVSHGDRWSLGHGDQWKQRWPWLQWSFGHGDWWWISSPSTCLSLSCCLCA